MRPLRPRRDQRFANGGAGYASGTVAYSLGHTSSCLPFTHWAKRPALTMPVPSGRNFTEPITVVMSVAAIASRTFSRSRLPGLGLEDHVREVLGARRVLGVQHHLVAGRLAGLRPRGGHLASPVGLLLEDRDALRTVGGGKRVQHGGQRLADVGRFPERREQVTEDLLELL